MKKSSLRTSMLIALIFMMTLFSANFAFAQATTTTAPASSGAASITCSTWHPTACVNIVAANGVNLVLGVFAFLLGITGEILNVSIVMTLHIKDFIDTTPAIYTVWQTIRDISGLFFIFFLLYAAIQMMLGDEAKFGHTIKNIVITGILINFSFFIVSLGIDASNVVSLAIYNQMLPNTSTVTFVPAQNGQSSTNLTSVVTQIESKGGISDIFMNSLKVSKLYDPKANDGSGGVTGGLVLGPLKIIFIGVAGIIMMLATAVSFLIASVAFVVRLGILIFILAFSPILFLSWMSPELKEQSGKILNILKNQLIFMPVYLLLTYVALSILNNSNLIGAATTQTPNFLPTGTNWTFPFIVLAINFTLVIFMLNLPLVVGIAMSGNISKKVLEKFNAQNIWKNFGSQAGSRIFGRAAYSLNQAVTPKLASFSPLAGSLSNSAFSSVSKAGFGVKKGGYEDRLKAKKKSEESLHKQIGEIDESKYKTKEALDAAKARAKGYQANYREGLPWKGKVGGVIGFMVDNRANRQTSAKLKKDVSKQDKKEAKKDAEKKIKNLKKEKEELTKTSPIVLPGRLGEEVKANKEARLAQIDADIEVEQQKINEGTEVENEEGDKKIMDKLDAIESKGDSGGGGGGGSEKKDDKK